MTVDIFDDTEPEKDKTRKQSKAAPKVTPKTAQNRLQEGQYEPITRPECRKCSQRLGVQVLMVQLNTQGPIAYYACPNASSPTNPDGECDVRNVKISRKWKPATYSDQHSVAARPDMH